jgi:hypothetical protein
VISEEERSKLRLAKYAGEKLDHPCVGDRVVVTDGDHTGETFEVLAVGGHAFHPAYRVYVKGPREETLWYWAWNLEAAETEAKK